ncbi:MAG: DUF393 domain-containing protein [Candidatus Peribacteraceae bacterium]|nr:DUF393 domain-containing protein [Candidatus Peribacteraceae bacterium]
MNRSHASTPWLSWKKFWFAPVSASGFGLMRIAFGLCALTVYLLQMPYIWYYYSDKGIFPPHLVSVMLRHAHRFSLLDSIHTPLEVTWLYSILIAALICVTIGIFTRPALLVTTILLFSFHEYALVMLDGSDTVLRLICFLLLLAPSGRAFSLDSAIARVQSWRHLGHDIPHTERRMSIWPYRLLLWQMICLYVSSAIGKMQGDMWWNGTAVQSVLLHPWFSRVSPDIVHRYIEPLSPILTIFTVLVQILWLGILILAIVHWFVPKNAKRYVPVDAYKRALILCGVLLHGGIAVFMDVGVFSFAMMTAYIGLFTDTDFEEFRHALTKHARSRVVILYDGHCRLCRRMMAILSMLDWLQRLQLVDYHDASARKRIVPTTSLATLSHVMHAKLPNGKLVAGFFAFRAITWHLPFLWLIAPFLYAPGIDAIGAMMYEKVAANRISCKDGVCKI